MVVAGVLASASMAMACVTFMGQLTVDGHDGDTTVVGTGNSHGYCSTGRPTTAAAGHIDDSITATVSPAPEKCKDKGATNKNKLPDGTYEVRFNHQTSYTFDGTQWNMIPGTGCFASWNAVTTETIGSLTVAGGHGSWTGTLFRSALGPVPYFPPDGVAGNFCVGSATTGNGLLAPYRLLAI